MSWAKLTSNTCILLANGSSYRLQGVPSFLTPKKDALGLHIAYYCQLMYLEDLDSLQITLVSENSRLDYENKHNNPN